MRLVLSHIRRVCTSTDGRRVSRPACSEYRVLVIFTTSSHSMPCSYLRTRPAAQAIQFTVDQSFLKKKTPAVMPTPSPSPSPNSKGKAEPSTPKVNGSASVKVESVTPSLKGPSSSSEAHSNVPSPSPGPNTSPNDDLVSLDPRTAKAAAEDPDFAAALQRQRDRELEEAKLMCSLENKEACTMCSA